MTIIVAIDLTAFSRDLAALGVRLARAFGDNLVVAHAVDARFSPNTADGFPAPDDLGIMIDAAEETLRELKAGLGAQGVAVETRVLAGPPDAALESLARELGARMIVAGTHGRGVLGRMLAGSVADRLVLRMPCPVLVIRPGQPTTAIDGWLQGQGALRVVVGVDRGDHATEAALAAAQKLSERGPCEFTLVHEYWPPNEYLRLGMRGPRDLFETDAEVAAILDRELKARLGPMASAPNVRLRVCAEWGPLGDALAREAHVAGADLIIVGSSQPHGWRRLKRASVALSALRFAPVPLLCVPERALAPPHQPETAEVAATPRAEIAPPLRSVLAATDLSEAGNAAISYALSLLRGQGGIAHVCTVRERALPSPAYAYGAEDGALTHAQTTALEDRLHALIPAEAKALGIECRVGVIDGGDAAEQIVAAALRLGVDAIVVASHGRSGIRRAVLGSVAEGVLHRATLPVYVVRRSASASQ